MGFSVIDNHLHVLLQLDSEVAQITSLPDLRIDIKRCLAAEEGVALEVRISGTQLGSWADCRPPADRWCFRCADSFLSMKEECSPVSASTTTVEACCARWDFITILNPT